MSVRNWYVVINTFSSPFTDPQQGRNTGVKAIFGSSVKKPLMTKVSMRHLNEIVRERNQYSRDAMEAWQDFINLKSRMDGELVKVTKRNNFLVDELESWKQQFLKFQAFAEQLTKETQELKVKIENHKREHRRLTSLIEQQKGDTARLTVKLSGAEKQRDDALEALVLQQAIAEELERERKRNRKELSALQHTNNTIIRQRDESQRVVLHLRSLIDGQTHHMEHIIRSLNKGPELNEHIGEGFEDAPEELDERDGSVAGSDADQHVTSLPSEAHRSVSRTSMHSIGEKVTPEMESQFFASLVGAKPGSRLSIADMADRHLRDKTDAIADIIRNISDQCAAAVEGLQLAHDADSEEQIDPALLNRSAHQHTDSDGDASMHTDVSQLGAPDDNADADSAHGASTGHLTPNGDKRRQSMTSTIPPTPDLIGGRSNTAMSGYSASTGTTHDRNSREFHNKTQVKENIGVVGDDEVHDSGSETGLHVDNSPINKKQLHMDNRPLTTRIVA